MPRPKVTALSAVQRKWGEKGGVTKSLDALEKSPHSEERINDLKRNVAGSALHEDQEIMAAIKRLIDAQANAPAATSSAKFEQSGGKMTGVGAIGTNTGPIILNRN
jgi:hypothetical protein